jgi:CDP-diacylglycerol--glycerol-3-phosphate 3-phosphatidyltransferase
MRIPLAIIFAILITKHTPLTFGVILSSLILIGLIELTDLLDGFLARRINMVTEWGAMLDPYSDSISRLIIYWAFAVSGLVIPIVPIAMAFRDITVAYCRITLSRFGRSVKAMRSGKIKAWCQGLGAVFIVLGPLYWEYTGEWTIILFSWLIIVTTLASIIEYAYNAVSVALKEIQGNR